MTNTTGTTQVTNIQQQTLMLQYLQQLQNQSTTLETQISTGEKSQTYAGLTTQASQAVNLTATESQQQSYMNTIQTVTNTLQIQSLAMQNIASIATSFQNTLETSAFSTSGASIQETAQQLLTELGSYMNTQNGSSYIFSGNQTSTPTFDPTNLPNPGDLTTNVASDYYGGDNGIASATVDNNVTMQYGVTGNNSAFEQIVRVLNYFANDSTPLSQSNSTDVANVNQAQQMLGNAAQAVQQLVATNGEEQGDLTQLNTSHQNALSLAQTSLNGIEQVDSATAITQLNTLQTQLEASYQTINVLHSLSLANYLSS
jgi:flagellar hook-associated protein 3 FlgL